MYRRIATLVGWLLVAAALLLLLAPVRPAPPEVLLGDGGADAVRDRRRFMLHGGMEAAAPTAALGAARRLGDRTPVKKPPSPKPSRAKTTMDPAPPPPPPILD